MLPDHSTTNMERAMDANRARDLAAVGAAAGALRAVPGAPENSGDLTRRGGVDLAGTGGSNPLDHPFGESFFDEFVPTNRSGQNGNTGVGMIDGAMQSSFWHNPQSGENTTCIRTIG